MKHPRNLNFITPGIDRLRLLQGSIIGVCSLCAALTWVVFDLPGSGEIQRAFIAGDAAPDVSSTVTPDVPRVSVLSEFPAHSVAASVDGLIRFVEESTGRILSSDVRSGLITPLADRKTSGLLGVLWSPDGRRGYLQRSQGEGLRYWLLDVPANELSPLASAITSLAVSPDGTRLALVRAQDEYSSIELADPQGQAVRTLLRTRSLRPQVFWPAPDTVILTTTDASGAVTMALVSEDGVLSPLVRDRQGLEFVWSPQGEQVLLSYADDDNSSVVSILGATSRIEYAIPLITSARKCAWQGERRLICAVPHSEGQLSGTSSDMVATRDSVVTFSLDDMSAQELYESPQSKLISVIDPVIDRRGRVFVFRNLYDRLVYALPLP